MRIFEVFEVNGELRNAAQLAGQTGAEKLLVGKFCIHDSSFALIHRKIRNSADLTLRKFAS